MGLDLPDGLQSALAVTGEQWPQADETILFERARSWSDLAETGAEQRGLANGAVAQMLADNTSDGLTRFAEFWERLGGTGGHFGRAVQVSAAMAIAYAGGAGIVLGLKVAMMAQLGVLAVELAALAGTLVTRGVLARVLVVAHRVQLAIQGLVRTAVAAITALGPPLAQIAGASLDAQTAKLNSRPSPSRAVPARCPRNRGRA